VSRNPFDVRGSTFDVRRSPFVVRRSTFDVQSSPRRPRPRSDFTSLRWRFDSSRFSLAARFGLVGRRGFGRRAASCSSDEPGPRGFAVLRLGAVFAAVDQQHLVHAHAGAGQRRQARFHVGRERRRADIEAKLDRGRHLVHVLPTGSRGADEPFLEIALLDADGVSNTNHG